MTTTLIVIVITYVALSCLLYFMQESLIFLQPTINPVNKAKYKDNQFSINRNNITLNGWLIESPNKHQVPLIIYYGGNAEEVSSNLDNLAKIGNYSFLFLNYRGYGESEGKPSEQHLTQDALFVFDYMTQTKGYQADNIILFGRSLGTGIATHVASQRPVKAITLVTPYDSLYNISRSHYPYFPVSLLLKHKFDSLSIAPNIHAPTLILMAEHDRVIPREHTLNLIHHWPGQLSQITITQADHNNISSFTEYWLAIRQFLLLRM